MTSDNRQLIYFVFYTLIKIWVSFWYIFFTGISELMTNQTHRFFWNGKKAGFWRRTQNWFAHFLFWWTESMFNKINTYNTKFHTIILSLMNENDDPKCRYQVYFAIITWSRSKWPISRHFGPTLPFLNGKF